MPERDVHPDGQEPSAPAPFLVVGIGASAGGLEALKEFLPALNDLSRMALVLVQHQAPQAVESLLPGLLRRLVGGEVLEAADGLALKPGHLYVSLPGQRLGLLRGRLQVMDEEIHTRPKAPIDAFFRSLALDQGPLAAVVVLSGADSDGSLGLREIKAQGGIALAQSPDSAKFTVMPQAAVATGLVDFVHPPGELAAALEDFARRVLAGPVPLPGPESEAVAPKAVLDKVLCILKDSSGQDFSQYKRNTVLRRVRRRMDIQRVERPQDYPRLLAQNPVEVSALVKDLLIGVTSFFRDPEAFTALEAVLRERILPGLGGRALRVWVPACSTGEEAYSVAMVLAQCLGEAKIPQRFQIYATDLDPGAIETARQGAYPANMAADLPDSLLGEFFERQDGFWRLKKSLREVVVFAVQNVLRDPPFSRMDLICCRNLLIYLDASAQKSLMATFHYALNPGGLLFLGPSESVGGLADAFAILDKKWRIYAKAATQDPLRTFARRHPGPAGRRPEFPPRPVPAANPPLKARDLAQSFLLKRCTLPGVLANRQGDILYVHGDTGKYLQPAPGEPSLNLLSMAREGLRLDLSAALAQAAAKDRDVIRRNVALRLEGKTAAAHIHVRPLEHGEGEAGMFMVLFEDAPGRSRKPRADGSDPAGLTNQHLREMEQELADLRESLQSSVEEYETTNEELRSANEELQSINEELQSASEEQETAKEELQSVNEELITLNAELQSKIDELSGVSNDLANLLASTEIATLFLDNGLHITRFTPAMSSVMNLLDVDLGREVSDIALRLDQADLVRDCREVLATLNSRTREVRGPGGAAYLLRIMPYRTTDNIIEGLVVTFTDVTALKQAEAKARQAQTLAEGIVETVREPLLVLDQDLRVEVANRAFRKLFGVTPAQTLGQMMFELGDRQWDIPGLRQALAALSSGGPDLEDFAVEHDFPGLGRRRMVLNARQLLLPDSSQRKIFLAFWDVAGQQVRARQG